jgi:V8-like Glu-specific endopeptidase
MATDTGNPRDARRTELARKLHESVESSVESDRAGDPLFVPDLKRLLGGRGLEALTDEGVQDDPYAFLIESICGSTDDSQPVEQYDGTLGVTAGFVAAHQQPVVQVQWNDNLASLYTNPGNVSGVRWGTGTMVGPDLMLTCGHLFDQTGGGWQRPRQNGTTNIISPQEIAQNMRVNFNFQVDPSGTLRTEQSFAIVELIEYRLGGLDMAVCRIAGSPGSTFGVTQISTTDASGTEMLCIIGHPAGLPKRIEAGPLLTIDGNLIRYNDIDTLGGNSGSGILQASTGRLVGVHTNGGCNAAGTGSNFGQRIAAVIAASPTLQGLTAPKLKVIDDPIFTLKFRDDQPPKFKVLDDPKSKFIDDPIFTLKFRDDQPPKFKAFDDVKQPGLDKRFGDTKQPGLDKGFDKGFDGRPPIDPGLAGGARPFILSTPHHAAGLGGEQQGAGGDARAQHEAALIELHQTMAQHEAALQQLDQQYRQLEASYRAAYGGGA